MVSPAPAVLKVSDVAALLRMGERQVREGIYRGEIPCHKIGSQLRCSRVAIERWLHGAETREEGITDGLEVGASADQIPTGERYLRELSHWGGGGEHAQ